MMKSLVGEPRPLSPVTKQFVRLETDEEKVQFVERYLDSVRDDVTTPVVTRTLVEILGMDYLLRLRQQILAAQGVDMTPGITECPTGQNAAES